MSGRNRSRSRPRDPKPYNNSWMSPVGKNYSNYRFGMPPRTPVRALPNFLPQTAAENNIGKIIAERKDPEYKELEKKEQEENNRQREKNRIASNKWKRNNPLLSPEQSENSGASASASASAQSQIAYSQELPPPKNIEVGDLVSFWDSPEHRNRPAGCVIEYNNITNKYTIKNRNISYDLSIDDIELLHKKSPRCIPTRGGKKTKCRRSKTKKIIRSR